MCEISRVAVLIVIQLISSQRMEPGPTLGACLHTGPSPEAPHGRIKPRTDYDPDLLRQMRKEANYRSTQQSEKVGYPDKDTRYVGFRG